MNALQCSTGVGDKRATQPRKKSDLIQQAASAAEGGTREVKSKCEDLARV